MFYIGLAEAASWSVSESDITGQGVDDGEDDDGNLEFANVAPDGGMPVPCIPKFVILLETNLNRPPIESIGDIQLNILN